jgi:hypothetical protein
LLVFRVQADARTLIASLPDPAAKMRPLDPLAVPPVKTSVAATDGVATAINARVTNCFK